MNSFLQRFGRIVLGILCSFDRLVFRGKLCSLYAPEGMNCYLSANKVLRKDFDGHAREVTQRVLQASLVERAKSMDRFEYLKSSKLDKNKIARGYAAKHRVEQGLVCVLQCVEPCWSFELQSVLIGGEKRLTVRGEQRKCSHLYHYFMDPQFGWMYVRLQTWFPFEIQVYTNGREWLCRQMDKEKLRYRRSDNKIVWVEDWQRAQQLADELLQTNWPTVLDAWRQQVHPLHPQLLGNMSLDYNWTVHQGEWATDVAFASRTDLETWLPRWQRQALNYDSSEVLRFLGRSGTIYANSAMEVQTEHKRFYEGLRIKHWADSNSLKLYDHENIARVETTINNTKFFRVYRTSQTNPDGPKGWRVLRRSVADLHRRAVVSQKVNERYLEGMATVKETTPVKELVEPMCSRVKEPGKKTQRKLRALNPWSKEDAALLTAISDPKWMIAGIRNRDLVEVLYPKAAADAKEKRSRSARVTRLLRLLRGHGLLQKVPKTHRYQVGEKARTAIAALFAAGNANLEDLTPKAA